MTQKFNTYFYSLHFFMLLKKKISIYFSKQSCSDCQSKTIEMKIHNIDESAIQNSNIS